MDSAKAPYQYSLRLLAKRDYSRFKLKQKLVARGFSTEDIECAIEELVEKNYLREEEYMRIRVKTLILNGHANKVIQHRLSSEELYPSDQFIDQLRSSNDMDSDSVINSLIEKKLRSKTIPKDQEERNKLKNKLLNHLISKGYEYAEVKGKVSGYLNE